MLSFFLFTSWHAARQEKKKKRRSGHSVPLRSEKRKREETVIAYASSHSFSFHLLGLARKFLLFLVSSWECQSNRWKKRECDVFVSFPCSTPSMTIGHHEVAAKRLMGRTKERKFTHWRLFPGQRKFLYSFIIMRSCPGTARSEQTKTDSYECVAHEFVGQYKRIVKEIGSYWPTILCAFALIYESKFFVFLYFFVKSWPEFHSLRSSSQRLGQD